MAWPPCSGTGGGDAQRHSSLFPTAAAAPKAERPSLYLSPITVVEGTVPFAHSAGGGQPEERWRQIRPPPASTATDLAPPTCHRRAAPARSRRPTRHRRPSGGVALGKP
ncbi:unnamed protein product [Miscanthus lutarioriparius]|uniref:Uncharacterized protein n=1 Tax=Miscanthus lutarioriparius TaxID=422564 RepID=A0A811S0C2_9POAL|nr:unnamed protein product [Miscanthus lutarioriparius]